MNSQQFRTKMIELIREFDNWAWKDQMANPQDWPGDMTFENWSEMFFDYIKED